MAGSIESEDEVGSPLAWIDDNLSLLDKQDLLRKLRTRTGGQSAAIELDGRRLVNFGSNDYLGLAGDERLAAAAIEAIQAEGSGSGASPLVSGRGRIHERLEQALAEFEGCESALLFPSGFAANAGTIPALIGVGGAIFSDSKNHASLIDGCRLSQAAVHIYRHGDVGHLEELLRHHHHRRKKLIVTDSLFSMDGDLAPLKEIMSLARKHGCMLMVDEAHATGVFGEQGRGVAEHLGVEDAVDIKVGTLSKALGAAGGFVCGSRALIDWLANRARPYVFSTATPPVVAAAALAALQIVRDEPQRRRNLLATAAKLRARLREQGWRTGHSESQIAPVIIGDAEETMQMSARLAEAGFFVPGIRPPSVPPGESLLRISLISGHTEEMIENLARALGAPILYNET